MDDKKKKKYLIPEALIVSFSGEDIITSSTADDEWWYDDSDNGEWWDQEEQTMNKKLLLLALPALMVLSGCGRVNNTATRNDFNFLQEDNLAHEEIFGGEAIKDLAIRKMADVGSDTDYKVGYQIHFDDKGDEDASNDAISIRFIAAIKADYTVKRWTRGVTNYYGTELKALSDHRHDDVKDEDVYFDSKVVYTHLANGAGNDEMTAGDGLFADYTGFVIYSLLNIPYEANKNAYIGVTLTLDELKTDFYAVKIEKNALGTASAHSFKFASNKEGFFLSKGDAVIDADASTRGDNAASFTANFAADDEFLVVQKTASLFKVWSGDCLSDEDENVVKDSGLVKINTASKYVIFLNNSNNIYHTKYSEPTSFYVRGTAAQGWADEDCVAAYQFVTDPDNKAVLLGVSLTVGDFKISDLAWSHSWGYKQCKDGGDFWKPNGETGIVIGGAASNFEEAASDDNIHCKVAGTYNIYLTNNWYVSFELAA